MIGTEVLVKVSGNNPAAPGLYSGTTDGKKVYAWLPDGWKPEAVLQVVALFSVKGAEFPLCARKGEQVTSAQIRQFFPTAQVTRCLFEKSCGAVVFYREKGVNQYLLIQNRSQKWGFPKGHIEPFETEEETACREILEETGLEAELLPGFRQITEYFVQERSAAKNVVYFIAQVHSKVVHVPAGEIGAYKLLTYENALSQLSFQRDRALLADAQTFLEGYSFERK